jgi:hypothetical protein
MNVVLAGTFTDNEDTTTTSTTNTCTRRNALHQLRTVVGGLIIATGTGTTTMPTPCYAVVDDASVTKLRQAKASLHELIQNFDTIVQKGGGDGIRRYLGTVGKTSGLFNISKVLKDLQGEADEVIEYVELKNDFEYLLQAADTAAYSANFVEYSSAKGKPEDYYKEAKRNILQMDEYLNQLMLQVHVGE